MSTQVTKTTFEDQKIFVGLDVHKKDFKVSVLVGDRFYKTFTTPPDPVYVVNYLQNHFPGAEYHCAYEAGFCGFHIHKKLVDLNIHSIVVNPADIPTTQKERLQKEDKRDSRKIATQLQAGHLKGIYIPSDELLEDRWLVRTRDMVSKETARQKQRIKSDLLLFGIPFPIEFESENRQWSKRFVMWLTSLNKYPISVKVDCLTSLRKQKLEVTRQIRLLSNSERYSEYIKLLNSVPGIAMISAMKFLTEIGDINRFGNFNQLCSYCGLIPSTHSSSDHERVNGITLRQNVHIRKSLIESAWVAIRNDPALMKSYIDYRKRMKDNRAIIRIAKKLLNRIAHVLRTRQHYLKNIECTSQETA